MIAQDFARCHVELRKVLRNCSDAYGSDADKVEFRYADRAARLEAGSSRLVVPSTWFVCSHISGVGLNNLLTEGRKIGGHVEAPDQAMQYSQLAALHDPWFRGSVGDGPAHAQMPTVRRSVVRTPASPANVHVVLDSMLVFSEPHVVPKDALALACHDSAVQLRPLFLAPCDGQAAQVVVAEPREANDPARAALLPPLPHAAIAFQPEQAVNGGFFAKDYKPALVTFDDKASAITAVAKNVVFPKAQTLIGQGASTEERRERALRKMPPPRPSSALLDLKFDKDAPSLSSQVMEKVVLRPDTLASIEQKIFNKVPQARRQLELEPQEVLELQAAQARARAIVTEHEAVSAWLLKYKDKIDEALYKEQALGMADLD